MADYQFINAQNQYVARSWYRTGWGMAIIIFLILLVAAGAVVAWIGWGLWSQINSAASTTLVDPSAVASQALVKSAARQELERTDRPYLGSLDAKVVIVEFSDFQCPYCTEQFPIIRELTNQYQDDILYIYRQFPIIDDSSLTISEASLCAHDQGKFWSFHDRLFINHDQLVVDSIGTIAAAVRQAGLNIDMFETCMNEHAFRQAVMEDAQAGIAAGVEGTPTFFINGNRLGGPASRDKWQEIIEGSLALIKGQSVN